MLNLLFLQIVQTIIPEFSPNHKEVTFIGKGILSSQDYRSTGSYWTYTKIIVGDGITELGTSCFAVTQVGLPESCTKIGSDCFYGCWNLLSIILPSGIEDLYSGTFRDCVQLKNITLPSSLKSISTYFLFAACNKLEKFIISGSSLY